MQSFHASLTALALACVMVLVGCKEQPPQTTPEATSPSVDAGFKEDAAGATIAEPEAINAEDMEESPEEIEPLKLQLDDTLFPATKSGLMPRMNDPSRSSIKHLIGNGQKPGLLPTKE